MDKQIYSFQDERLTSQTAAGCDLNLIIGSESASLSIGEKGGRVTALQSWYFMPAGRHFADVEQEIRAFLGREEKLKWSYQRVRCALSNANVTLVPRRLFDPRTLSTYFKLLLPETEYEYRYDALPEFDCFLVYAVEETVLRNCRQYFPNAEIRHLAGPLLLKFRGQNIRKDYEMLINLRNQTVQVTVFERHNLMFFNTFQWEKPADLLYHLLLVYDQFRLNPLEAPLLIAGNLVEDSEIYRLLYRYFRHMRFASMQEMCVLPAELSLLPPHCFYDILSLNAD